jgi:hypothetical protein
MCQLIFSSSYRIFCFVQHVLLVASAYLCHEQIWTNPTTSWRGSLRHPERTPWHLGGVPRDIVSSPLYPTVVYFQVSSGERKSVDRYFDRPRSRIDVERLCFNHFGLLQSWLFPSSLKTIEMNPGQFLGCRDCTSTMFCTGKTKFVKIYIGFCENKNLNKKKKMKAIKSCFSSIGMPLLGVQGVILLYISSSNFHSKNFVFQISFFCSKCPWTQSRVVIKDF